jgi:16S rRNA C967 or C1407 C5-methylase (RsmB/RsmF family)/NOL1/NOP2/fmu family ribosome biogenesis protein
MAALLGDDELDSFLTAMRAPRVRGLRLNPAKTDAAQLRTLLDSELAPVAWCPNGFSFTTGPLGGHPAHLAGLYYLQEPSAMLVAPALDPAAGARVADLAAAPGGKTTHLSALVGPHGCVVANEHAAARLGSLHASLDLWGGQGVVTTGQPLHRLAGTVAPFDGIVLDAPCTGEGLFRRRPAAVRDWSPATVAGSARRQARLLNEAAALLAPHGVLVYSTCTFNREENEDRVVAFLDDHPEWTVEPLAVVGGAVPGLDGLGLRLWPHRVDGEGQYVARLSAPADWEPTRPRRPRETRPDPAVRAAWLDFARSQLADVEFEGDLVVRGDTVYCGPSAAGVDPAVLARPGLPLGRARPGRFEPAHALATTLRPEQAAQHLRWTDDDPALAAYLSGNVVDSAGRDGWVLVCWRDWPIGWARRTGGVLKNHLPDAVRRMALS